MSSLGTHGKEDSCLIVSISVVCTDGDSLGQFAIIQQDEGEWGLIVKEPLDRETKDRYKLKIIATDGKFEMPVTVDVHVLDINDNSPVCEQVNEHVANGNVLPLFFSIFVEWRKLWS